MTGRESRAGSLPARVLLLVLAGCALTACTDSGDDPEASAPSSTLESSEVPTSAPPTSVTSSPPSGSGIGRRNAQEKVLDTLPGSPNGDCVEVGSDDRDVRSGDFGAGPFDEAGATEPAPDGSLSVRIYWIPAHADGSRELTVRATPEGSGDPVVTRTPVLADADQWLYYDSELQLPEAGRWRLEASAGPDRGCFVADLGS